MGGDKKPSAEYFQSGPRQDGARRGVPLRRADPARAAHDRRGPRGALVGGHARLGRERHAVGGVHARVGDRRDLRRDRPGPRDGRHELDGARHGAAASRAGCRRRSASAASRSARSAAAPPSPPRATGSPRSAAPGRGKVYRFAQIVAAAALCLEISASAAMATAGSENFFQAHHERGGLTVIALVFRYEVRDPADFERVYGPEGEWAQFFRSGAGYIGTELLRDVEEPDRYLVIDRWESARRLQRVSRRATATSTCAGATRRGSTTCRSCASARSRTSGGNDVRRRPGSGSSASRPGVLGLRRQPDRAAPAAPGRRGPDRVRGVLLVRRAPSGRPRDRARRARRRRARRGSRPPCDLVRVPGRDGADLRPLPPPGADQHRAPHPRLARRRTRPATPRQRRTRRRCRDIRRVQSGASARPARALPRTPEGRAAADRWAGYQQPR